MKKHIIVLFLLTVVIFTSCRKEITPPPATTINELQAENTFTWTTSQTVEVEITGLPTVIPVQSTLTIFTEEGQEIYKVFHTMSENITCKVVIPASHQTLKLTFGSFVLTSTIEDHKARFSFIPADDNQ